MRIPGWKNAIMAANGGHEGTDLMPPRNQRGFYPVMSITAGGWKIWDGWKRADGGSEVRSEQGGYFYYAHLSEYGRGSKWEKTVESGELLGYMGDSRLRRRGHGQEIFAVHLHFGIYIQTADGQEVSVDPYWILKGLEGNEVTIGNDIKKYGYRWSD